jgi:hypothetical protein
LIRADDLQGNTFDFLRINGELIASDVQLLPDGTIQGVGHPNETYWEIAGSGLVFLDAERQPTTRFTGVLRPKSGLLLLGAFLPEDDRQIRHVLAQSTEVAELEHRLSEALEHHAHDLRQTLNLVARKSAPAAVVRVLFLVHNIDSWDSLMDLYQAMLASDFFEPVVATLPRMFRGATEFSDEESNHEGLERLDIPHLRFAMPNSWEALDIIKALAPDIIFRQGPWELDVPPAFGAAELAFSRLCYVPYYGFNLLDRFTLEDYGLADNYGDQFFHRMCWRIYCETEETQRLLRSKSARGGDHVVVAGHPKLDRLWNARQRPHWPLPQDRRRFRLVWAPHHSITTDWLGFGTFMESYPAMLEWAREDQGVEIVLKPHPRLFNRMQNDYPGHLDRFFESWQQLPNTATAEGCDYGPLFAASDAMLTDGISFLAEYQLFDRPLIFLDSGHHAPFNEIGRAVTSAAYGVDSVAAARGLIENFRKGGGDPLKTRRAEVLRTLMPFPGQSVERILDDIRRGLSGCSSRPQTALRTAGD